MKGLLFSNSTMQNFDKYYLVYIKILKFNINLIGKNFINVPAQVFRYTEGFCQKFRVNKDD